MIGSQQDWPITFDDVRRARERIRHHLPPTALRRYAPLDEAVGSGLEVYVKHENHNPTNSFKVRNAFSVMTTMSVDERRRGVVAATRGNHGLGLAHAGSVLGVPVTLCVPEGNNPDKNAAMRGLGATLVEEGRDYDDAVEVAYRVVADRGARLVHSTAEPLVLAGAGTMALEIVEARPELEALVLAVGGGSQAVGALTVARRLRPGLEVYGVQAANAPAVHDSWHAGEILDGQRTDTFADGLATRKVYDITFKPMRAGLAGFVTVSEREIADAVRLLLETTHNLAEGAGATGLAGLLRLRDRLKGRKVGIVISGGNIDLETLRQVLDGRMADPL